MSAFFCIKLHFLACAEKRKRVKAFFLHRIRLFSSPVRTEDTCLLTPLCGYNATTTAQVLMCSGTGTQKVLICFCSTALSLFLSRFCHYITPTILLLLTFRMPKMPTPYKLPKPKHLCIRAHEWCIGIQTLSSRCLFLFSALQAK